MNGWNESLRFLLVFVTPAVEKKASGFYILSLPTFYDSLCLTLDRLLQLNFIPLGLCVLYSLLGKRNLIEKSNQRSFRFLTSQCLHALSYKFQMDVYFFEVYTHCEAPKLISNKFVIHPFCDFPKLKLTHREEFPSLGGHQKPLPAGWTSRISQ